MTDSDTDEDGEQNALNALQHDRLAAGLAGADSNLEGDSDSDTYTARIVPIGEGDTTTGLSEKSTFWDRETLKTAVEQGAFDGAKILKGTSGNGHKDMLSLADPDSIIGSVDSWDYEDGVGPVGEGSVLDEHMAKLIDHDLIEVSPDMWRELGEYDEERDAYTVEKLTSVPYLTLVDRGAGERASIEPARAEALGFTEWEEHDGEQEQNDGEGAQSGDESAESDRDTEDNDMPSKEELQEQLAAAQAELNQKEEQINEKEEQIDTLEDRKEDLETDLEETKETIEEKEERINTLESENEPLRQMLSERVADGSALSAEQVAESNMTNEELADSIVENDGLGEDADDGKSSVEIVSEQLAASPSLRGETPEEEDEGGALNEEQLAAANDRAYELIDGNDVMNEDYDQLSPREFVQQYKGVDPAEYDSKRALRAAFERNGGEA